MLNYAQEDSCAGGSEPSGNTADTPDGDEPTAEKCVEVGDGEYCASPTGDKDCGYLNDTFVCLGKVQQDECKVLGDGGRVCGAGANTTPPVPDSGTPGELAEADGEMSSVTPAGSTTNYNYFNSSTVSASSRDPGTNGAVPTGGSPGYGQQDSEGSEEGPDCEGVTCGEGVPDLEDIGTMSEAFSGFWDDLQEVPIIEAAGDVAPSFGTGACPDWSDSVDVYGESIDVDFSSICTVYDDVSPALAIVALVLWGVLAYRVLMSA